MNCKKVTLFVNLSYVAWIQRGPHSNKISLERSRKKNWDQFAWDMASWRSQRNNNETFPRKTNGPTQLLQKFTTAQHHFFVKSFQQVWMKQKQDFSERKAWKNVSFSRENCITFACQPCSPFWKVEKHKLLPKTLVSFWCGTLLLVSCLYIFLFVKKRKLEQLWMSLLAPKYSEFHYFFVKSLE